MDELGDFTDVHNISFIERFIASLSGAEQALYSSLQQQAESHPPDLSGYTRFLDDLVRLKRALAGIEATVLDPAALALARTNAEENIRFTTALDSIIESAVDLLYFDNPESEQIDLSEGYSFDSKNGGFRRGFFDPLAVTRQGHPDD